MKFFKSDLNYSITYLITMWIVMLKVTSYYNYWQLCTVQPYNCHFIVYHLWHILTIFCNLYLIPSPQKSEILGLISKQKVKYYPQRAKTSKIRLGAAGLSASPPPALPALFRVFEGGDKISKKIQKRRLDLFRISERGGKPPKNF